MQWFEKMASVTAVLESLAGGKEFHKTVKLNSENAVALCSAITAAGINVRSIEIATLSRISDGERVNLAAVGNAVLRLVGND